MKRFTLTLAALTLCCSTLVAQTFNEWRDPEINEVNRVKMHSSYKIFDSTSAAEGAYCTH